MKKIAYVVIALVVAAVVFTGCVAPGWITGKNLFDKKVEEVKDTVDEVIEEAEKAAEEVVEEVKETIEGASGNSGSSVDDVKNAGKLVMATSPDFPPFEELQPNGDVIGIEVDILKAIAAKLGVELEIVAMDFESVVPGIEAGKFDVGVSGITITEKRLQSALFTQPYCLAAQAIVVVEGSPITCKADLEGKKVSVQTGTTAESYTMDNGYNVLAFAANSDAEMALVNGKVDAWVIDDLTAAEMVAAYNETADVQLVILSEAMTTEPYGFAFNLDSEELVAAVDAILTEMLQNGTIAEIFAAYNAPYTAPVAE